MDTLPDDVLWGHISPMLSLKENFRLARACGKKYRDLPEWVGQLSIYYQEELRNIAEHKAYYDKVWPHLEFLRIGDNLIGKLLNIVPNIKLQHLSALSVDSSPWNGVNEDLLGMLEKTPNLQYLDIIEGEPHPELLVRYATSLKYLSCNSCDLGLLAECTELEYLTFNLPIPEEKFEMLIRAKFAAKLGLLIIGVNTNPSTRDDEDLSILRRMDLDPEEFERRRKVIRPLLMAFPNLRCLNIIGTQYQIRAVSSLLCEREICPKLSVLLLDPNFIREPPMINLEGLEQLLSVKPLETVIWDNSRWPTKTAKLMGKLKYYSLGKDAAAISNISEPIAMWEIVLLRIGIGPRFSLKLFTMETDIDITDQLHRD